MSVTKEDIQNKEFSTKTKGYDKYEVDVFLDEIIDTFIAKEKEIESLQQKCSELYEKINSYKSMDSSLVEMFAIAKMKSDEVIQQANQQAEEIVKSAKEKGDAMISGVSQELENLKAETEKMKNQYHIFCIKFEAMLQNQLKLLKREDVEGELEEDQQADASVQQADAVEDKQEAAEE